MVRRDQHRARLAGLQLVSKLLEHSIGPAVDDEVANRERASQVVEVDVAVPRAADLEKRAEAGVGELLPVQSERIQLRPGELVVDSSPLHDTSDSRNGVPRKPPALRVVDATGNVTMIDGGRSPDVPEDALSREDQWLASAISGSAIPADERCLHLDALLDVVDGARFVLLGEASHGTEEFYEERDRITRRLISERGFHAIAVEADWPDAHRVNQWVRAVGSDASPTQSLRDFRRFPAWMWRNTAVVRLISWLRDWNDRSADPARVKAGFYGLDLYSLHASAEAVVRYLERVDPPAARRARERYEACFGHSGSWPGTSLGLTLDCERDVVAQLVELQNRRAEYLHPDGAAEEDAFFFAEQNARLVRNAQEYYRTTTFSDVSSWNVRDRHMADTADALAAFLDERFGRSRIVIWAHNSHLGDARNTAMASRGEWNVGQLLRERHGNDVVCIGFTTHTGTVTAASQWGGPAERKRVRPSLAGSYERLFHHAKPGAWMLDLKQAGEALSGLATPRLERFIGVIYRPDTERRSHYQSARLPGQFDAIVHVDESHAVEPLERTSEWEAEEAPETWPTGM